MPDPAITSFTTVFRAAGPRRAKRNRQAVSCTACQKRKSRCDRRQPCGACEKRGDEEACQFAPASSAAGSAVSSSAPASGGSGRYEIQDRLHRLEEMVKRLAEGPGLASKGTVTASSLSSSPSSSLMERLPQGSGMDIDSTDDFNDRSGNEAGEELNYHGPTSWAALVESIHDIRSALEAEGDGHLSSQPSEPDPDVVFGDLAPVTMEDIARALPARHESDKMVSAYFNAKYIAFPFLHTNHFRRRYEAFWKDPAATGFLWISTLFSILSGGALVCRARDRNASGESGPLLTMAARCLVTGRYLEGKPWSVEALTMHIHARSLQKIDADATVWSLYALAVRQAQRQGYHRKADKVSAKLTPFDAEMRRRVWLVIQCYDIVLSYQHGMPPMIHEDTFDTETPTNATDDDFDEDSVTITARPPTDPLPILAYVMKSKVLPILRRTMVYTLGVKTVSWEEVLETGRELMEWHASVPACLRYRPVRESSFTDANYTIMHRAMVEITYHMTVCSLYRPFISSAMRLGSDSEHTPALEHCRNSALRLVEIHMELDEATQPGGRLHEEKYMVSNLALHDFLVAEMILGIELIESKDMR